MELFSANWNAGSPAELLAKEEALLEHGDTSEHSGFLWFWEATSYFVVLGYGKQLAAEVFEEECNRLHMPILRRTSGGGTVLQGPGCLNYTVVLPIDSRGELESITTTNRYVMNKTRSALAPLVKGQLKVEGHTDLTIDGRKFSGNAQRRKRRCLLFHGSFLLDFDLGMISRTLRTPQQQPEYRAHRPHDEFITNLNVRREDVESQLIKAWSASSTAAPDLTEDIHRRAQSLVETKYSRAEWNRRA